MGQTVLYVLMQAKICKKEFDESELVQDTLVAQCNTQSVIWGLPWTNVEYIDLIAEERKQAYYVGR